MGRFTKWLLIVCAAISAAFLLVALVLNIFDRPSSFSSVNSTKVGDPDAPCVESPELLDAIHLVQQARTTSGAALVWGDPGESPADDLLVGLDESYFGAAPVDYKGTPGIVVSVAFVQNPDHLATRSIRKAAWVVLDGMVLPVNFRGAEALGVEPTEPPEEVEQRLGIRSEYWWGNESLLADDSAEYPGHNTPDLTGLLSSGNDRCTQPYVVGLSKNHWSLETELERLINGTVKEF